MSNLLLATIVDSYHGADTLQVTIQYDLSLSYVVFFKLIRTIWEHIFRL